ncbi:MFS transporter [Erwinia aphidicola]|jgi:EmrB/QacA subfamily drug resistance transporter|uniref:MFS transporter n=1 Tax=Erwinia aphidicola TaxID=68334 RepID=UPI00301B492C
MSYRKKVAMVYLLGFFLDLINMFISTVAYPAIGLAMQTSVAQLAWISNGYICGLTLIIPLGAWLTQRVGARRVLLASLVLFVIGTTLSGLARSIEGLIFWRIVQGIGGGLLIPVGQALTWQLYAKHERARLSSAVMLVALLAPAFSPALGGWLIQALNWRWIFFASLPLAIMTLILAFAWLKDGVRAPEEGKLDITGLLMGCAGLFLVLTAMTELADNGEIIRGGTFLLLGIVLLILFTLHNRRVSSPLFSFDLLSDPLMRYSMMVYQCVPGLFMGVSLVSILYLQTSLSLSPAATGALMIPWSIASFFALMITGKTFNHLGPRPLIIAGCLLQAAGIVTLSLVSHGDQYSLLMIAFALMGLGGSLCSSTAQSSAFLNIAAPDMHQASALWNINRQLSFCFGVALLSLLLNLLISHLPSRQAYLWTFYAAALGTVIPALLSVSLNNRSIKMHIKSEEKS